MKFYACFSLVILLLFIRSCNEDPKITFKDTTVITANNTIVEINIPEASGNKTISDKINSTINKYIIERLNLDDSLKTPSTTIAESIEKFNQEYIAFKTEFPESAIEWDAQIDGEVMYQSDMVISIALTTYLNTGGAHGILIINFLNFDTATGETIKNDVLFNNMSAFKNVAKPFFENEIDDKKELYFEPDNFVLPENIGFTDEGLILLYNTYEIAPYSSGITEFQIPYNDVEDLLTYK